jgi:hypothetical protein
MQAHMKLKSALKDLKSTEFNAELKLKEFEGLDRAALQVTDFDEGPFVVYNFAGWSDKVINEINQKIIPLKADIQSFQDKITERDNLLDDSKPIDVSDIPNHVPVYLFDQIQAYDLNSVLLPYFALSLVDLNYTFYSSPEYQSLLQDSSDVDAQLEVCSNVLKALSPLDSTLKVFGSITIPTAVKKYPDFLERNFGSVQAFTDEVEVKTQQLISAQETWYEYRNFWNLKARFAHYEDDSIPLFIPDPADSVVFRYDTKTVAKRDSLTYIGGVLNSDPAQAYLAAITKEREVIFLHTMPLEDQGTDLIRKSIHVFIPPTIFDKVTYLVYGSDVDSEDSTVVNRHYYLLAGNVNLKGAQQWISTFDLTGTLESIVYDDLVDEIKIYYEFRKPDGEIDVAYKTLNASGNWE